MQLIRFISAVTCTCILFAPFRHPSAQTPEERIEQIGTAASLVRGNTAPWHLRMTFQLYDLNGKASESGMVEEWWTSPGNHRLVITSPSYNLSIPGGINQSAGHRRERFLVNLLLDQVVDPVPHYGDFKNLKVSEVKQTFGQVELTCYNVERLGVPSSASRPASHPEFCVDKDHNDLRIRFDSGNFSAVRNRIAKFRGIELGLDNSLSYSGKQAISGHIESLESYDPANSPVELTHASEEPAVIPGIVIAGKSLKKEQPMYPVEARQEHISGSVILSAIISREGAISSLEIIASPDESLSRAAVSAVKHWTYTPYLLNGEPTEVDTTITVNFNLNGG
jgi:TonB family protein